MGDPHSFIVELMDEKNTHGGNFQSPERMM
jgi:hypothetical protein